MLSYPADGLHTLLHACCLQEKGLDTVDANRALGLPDDCREYTSVRNILLDMGVKSVRLIVSGSCSQHARVSLATCMKLNGGLYILLSNVSRGLGLTML